jgi:hypothetical protein
VQLVVLAAYLADASAQTREGKLPQALLRSPSSQDNSWGARPIIRSARLN